MHTTRTPPQWRIALLLGLTLLQIPIAAAEPVYKCLQNGKVTFTATPGEHCQSLDLQVTEPNPVDVARQKEDNSRYAADQAKRREELKQQADKKRENARKDAEARMRAQKAMETAQKEFARKNWKWPKDFLPPN